MVPLPLVQTTNIKLTNSRPLVAVFIGGTSGIGSHTIKALSKTQSHSGKGLRAYIVGRSENYGQEVLKECQTICPSGNFYFIKAVDMSLIKEVERTCAEIIRKEREEAERLGDVDGARIDILCMTQAIFKPFDGRMETKEGLDTYLSLLYYSRMSCINHLLPLLLSTPSQHPAQIISVFAPTHDTRSSSSLTTDDLSLANPENYGFMKVGEHVAFLTTFYFEHLAQKHAGRLALVHYYPGLVLGRGFNDPSFPWWFRTFFKFAGPFLRFLPFCLDGGESGERVLFCAGPRWPGRGGEGKGEGGIDVAVSSDGVVGGGAYRANWNNEIVPMPKHYVKLREEGWTEKCVEHTLKVWEVIEKEGVYSA